MYFSIMRGSVAHPVLLIRKRAGGKREVSTSKQNNEGRK
jgi:hypothetical protein